MSHEALAFVVGPPTVAGLQWITVHTQKVPHLVLQNPTTFFPGNAHPQYMLGGIQHEPMYCVFLDVKAHLLQPNDCTYLIVKVGTHRKNR